MHQFSISISKLLFIQTLKCRITLILFISLYLIFINNLNANNIKGYYISNSGDTIRVLFDIPMIPFTEKVNYEKLQKKVKYFDSLNTEHVLKPDLAREFFFEFGDSKIRMISRPNGIRHFKDKFIRLMLDGKIKLFVSYDASYYTQQTHFWADETESNEIEAYILQKNNGKTFHIKRGFSFRDDLMDFLSECYKLTKEIREKEYPHKEIPMIVKKYNAICNK